MISPYVFKKNVSDHRNMLTIFWTIYTPLCPSLSFGITREYLHDTGRSASSTVVYDVPVKMPGGTECSGSLVSHYGPGTWTPTRERKMRIILARLRLKTWTTEIN